MSAPDLFPKAISLESRIVELEEPSPWLCTSCCEPFEAAASGGRPSPQRCACQRDLDEPIWPGHDFNHHLELCHACGLVPLSSGGRFSVWFCPGCLVDVLRLNAEAGRTVVPVGRHSAQHGHVVTGGGSQGELQREMQELLGFAYELRAAIDRLEAFRRERVRTLLALDDHEDARRVRLAGFLARLGRSEGHHTSRRAAFAALARHFGFRVWPNEEITEVPDSPERDDWGTEVDSTYMAVCPVCGSPNGCWHMLICYDATFPGEPSEGPIEWLQVWDVFAAAWRLVAALEKDGAIEGRAALERRLAALGELPGRLQVAAAVGLESREFERSEYADSEKVVVDDDDPRGRIDTYAVNHYLDEYLEGVFGCCPGHYLGTSRHEDRVPLASSAYCSHWARDGEACADAAEEMIASDIARLDELRASVR